MKNKQMVAIGDGNSAITMIAGIDISNLGVDELAFTCEKMLAGFWIKMPCLESDKIPQGSCTYSSQAIEYYQYLWLTMTGMPDYLMLGKYRCTIASTPEKQFDLIAIDAPTDVVTFSKTSPNVFEIDVLKHQRFILKLVPI